MEKIKSFIIIPKKVLYDKNLSQGAKLLYGEIYSLCKGKGFCWAENSHFESLYDSGERTIVRWINQLVDNGYINREIKYNVNGKTVRYLTINFDIFNE
ncbi:MAG: helix-turn-helix domain-containing protein [Clostridiales bacterium]|jgi:CTP-dependent riboflavin kinase|nr:helix-turn-helix domain-containing protein [Clostridiales bacterium]